MDLPSLKEALLDPNVYPERPDEIGCEETHISLVFLTGTHAYKIKKPVDFGFLDFSSLERRKFFCEQEVILNRRLAPRIYLGVVPIAEEDGKVSLGGPGKIIEYAVKMEQISGECLMSHLIGQNKATPRMMEAIAERLVRFHSSSPAGDYVESFANPQRLKQDTDENFEQTERYVGVTISRNIYECIKTRTLRFMAEREGIFHRRVASHRIRDCHGDLRLEHICWGDELSIIDCIEFNERFRYTDVAADIGFLAMDVDYHGRPELNEPLLQSYVEKSGDEDLWNVLDFYKCYRAYVRGKVDSFRWDDASSPEEEKTEALKKAGRHFSLSCQYAQRL